MKPKGLLVLCILFACGGAGGVEAPPPDDECTADAECDDGIACSEDLCAVSVGGGKRCSHVARDDRCAPGEECALNPGASSGTGCRPAGEGACRGKPDGFECEPGDLCAVTAGVCTGGRCEYQRKECEPEDCRVLTGCDPTTGECLYEVVPDGTACLAPDLCAPSCKSGVCVGERADCDDSDPCTTDTCGEDGCHNGYACDDQDACTIDSCDPSKGCVKKPQDCDDHNACTEDSCDPATGCAHAWSCDDSNACTIDECDAAIGCRHNPVDCGDDDICTADECYPATGCASTPVHPCCGDHVTDSDEACDPGQDAPKEGEADLCSSDCEAVALQLTASGRMPVVASGDDLILVGWETLADGFQVTEYRVVEKDGSVGAPNRIASLAWEPGDAGPRPAAAPLDASRFLLATFDRVSGAEDRYQIRIRPVGKAGPEPVGVIATVPVAKLPGLSLYIDHMGGAGILAWGEHESSPGRDHDAYYATFEMEGDLPVPASPVRLGDETTQVAPGGACAGDTTKLVPWSTDSGLGADQYITVIDGTGPSTRQIGKPPVDHPLPPRCVSTPDGFAIMYFDASKVGSTHGYGMYSRLLDADGADTGAGPTLIGWWSEQSEDMCFPDLATFSRAGDGFVVACPFAQPPSGTPSEFRLKLIRLDTTGRPLPGGPEIVPGQEAPITFFVSASHGPGAAVTLAWDEMIELGTYYMGWTTIRARVVGTF